jgi:3-mercaptopyruvate sulfurtransferase SseA
MKNFTKLKAVLVICIAMLLEACASVPTQPKICEPTDSIPRITAQELKKLMDDSADIVVVDTLYPYWYRKEHIKGAINFPWVETIKEPLILPRNKLLVLYCDCECEETSADVGVQLVRDWGYKNVKVLQGGWAEWVKLGYPTEKGEGKR